MRRFLFLLISLLFCTMAMGQQQHTVLRGETTEDIAAKYGISVQDLTEQNPMLKMGCHFGMVLTIPEKKQQQSTYSGGSDSYTPDYSEAYSWIDKASAAYDRKDYTAAKRYYTKAIGTFRNDGSLYFTRGLCNLQLQQYGKADSDFQTCLVCKPGKDIEKRARDLSARAQDLKRRQDAENAQLLGGIALFTLGTALVAGTAIAASNAPTPRYGSHTPAFSAPSYNWGSSPRMNWSDLDRLDAQAKYEIARNTNAINAMSAQGVAMARMNQAQINADFARANQQMIADANWKMDMNNPVNQLSFELTNDYERNPQAYFSPESRNSRYSILYKEKYNRNPSGRELALFEEKFQAMLQVKARQMGLTSDENSGNNSRQSKSSSTTTHDYRRDYYEWEEIVKGNFESMRAAGGVHVDEGKKFSADSDNPAVFNTGMPMRIRDAQKEMEKIRLEAAKHGINIPQSKWETTQISYH